MGRKMIELPLCKYFSAPLLAERGLVTGRELIIRGLM